MPISCCIFCVVWISCFMILSFFNPLFSCYMCVVWYIVHPMFYKRLCVVCVLKTKLKLKWCVVLPCCIFFFHIFVVNLCFIFRVVLFLLYFWHVKCRWYFLCVVFSLLIFLVLFFFLLYFSIRFSVFFCIVYSLCWLFY